VVSNAYGRAAALLSARPVLTVIHSEHDFDYPNKILRWLYAVIEKLTRWKTASYITVSEYLKDGLIKNGIKSGKIAVIYNAVTPLPIKKTTKKKDLVIGSIGRLHPVKNYDALISAMKDLPKEAKLVIAGEGEERESLEKIIVENSLGDRVELLGYVKDIPGFLSSVDIYVQPSLSEGFGLTVIEAMQAGLAVVVSPGGALPELVEDGKTGIVAKGFSAKELTGALNKVIEDKKLRSELAEAGKKEALNKFKVEEWADKTVEAYLGVAK
jgi:glycosyltransferase involved in cell wall biosynthesis